MLTPTENMTSRDKYGVELIGVSGIETIWLDSRPTANRVRKVIKIWRDGGNWTGWKTLQDLAQLAADNKGKSAIEIISEYKRNTNKELE